MTDKPRRIRVKGVVEQPVEEQVRKISRALIALARAQLEKEAQAEHDRNQKSGKAKRGSSRGSSGDAA